MADITTGLPRAWLAAAGENLRERRPVDVLHHQVRDVLAGGIDQAGGMDHVQAGVLRGGGGAGAFEESREAGIVRRRPAPARNFTATGRPSSHRAPSQTTPMPPRPSSRSRRTEPTRAGRSRSTTAPASATPDQAIVIVSCAVATLDKRTEGARLRQTNLPAS